jgi:hypothetical protein
MCKSTSHRCSANVTAPSASTPSDSQRPTLDHDGAGCWLSSSEPPDNTKPTAAFAVIAGCPGHIVVSSGHCHHQPTSTTSAATQINSAAAREKCRNTRTTPIS